MKRDPCASLSHSTSPPPPSSRSSSPMPACSDPPQRPWNLRIPSFCPPGHEGSGGPPRLKARANAQSRPDRVSPRLPCMDWVGSHASSDGGERLKQASRMPRNPSPTSHARQGGLEGIRIHTSRASHQQTSGSARAGTAQSGKRSSQQHARSHPTRTAGRPVGFQAQWGLSVAPPGSARGCIAQQHWEQQQGQEQQELRAAGAFLRLLAAGSRD